MERRAPYRLLLNVTLMATALVLPIAPMLPPEAVPRCDHLVSDALAFDAAHAQAARDVRALFAAEPRQPDNRGKPERCKQVDGSRGKTQKVCPDGGERLPQDKRSPLDDVPPLSPLVA